MKRYKILEKSYIASQINYQTAMVIAPPTPHENYVSLNNYISKVTYTDLLVGLAAVQQETQALLGALTEEQANFRYAPEKWSIKELVLHLADSERIFAYRALRFARQDKTDLPGFDENTYVPVSEAEKRSMESLLREYQAVRQATIALFENFTEEMLNSNGTANDKIMTVRALGYAILGHEVHHVEVIKSRYLTA